MKKLLVLLMILTASYTFAQIESFDTEYIEGIKKDLKGTFKEIVEDNLKLNEDQAKIFWRSTACLRTRVRPVSSSQPNWWVSQPWSQAFRFWPNPRPGRRTRMVAQACRKR